MILSFLGPRYSKIWKKENNNSLILHSGIICEANSLTELSDFLEIKLRRNLWQASLLKRHRLTQWIIYGLIKDRTAVQMHASTTESL